jgi:hypothetical protein
MFKFCGIFPAACSYCPDVVRKLLQTAAAFKILWDISCDKLACLKPFGRFPRLRMNSPKILSSIANPR